MEFPGRANSIWKLACRCAISDGVPRRSLSVALIVGTVLNLINGGDALLGLASINWLKLILTYCVPYVVLINPRDKAPAVGWDAVKKDWQERVFEFWAELKLSPKRAPHIHIDQTTAWTTGVVGVEGKNKSGQALSFTITETQVYEKRGDRWLMVSHHASRVPE